MHIYIYICVCDICVCVQLMLCVGFSDAGATGDSFILWLTKTVNESCVNVPITASPIVTLQVLLRQIGKF